MDGKPRMPMRVAAICGGDAAAIETLVTALPVNPGFATIVACDSAPELADSLRVLSRAPVIDAREDRRLEADKIYVVPPGREASITPDGALELAPPNGRGGVDRLLRSIADTIGQGSIAVILSGRGSDGQLGAKRIKEVGGFTICQALGEGHSSEMVRSVIASGAVDLVVPLDEMVPRILRATAAVPEPGIALTPDEPKPDVDRIRDILSMIRVRTGHDFTLYKRGTLYRRIARRMQVCQTETLSEYQRYLRDQPVEMRHLLRDFLISVTNFFRDPDAYAALAQTIVPRLFEGKQASDQVRVWVAGCATGEEAYSIGILLSEHARRLSDPPQIQIFATDIDEAALTEARQGIYAPIIEADVSRERLERFFSRETTGYRVDTELREKVLFSPHNVLRDPPFSRLDLISCRNLLIYLNREAQDRVLATFHFALKPDGVLFLGSSESAEATQLFGPYDTKQRIYTRRVGPSTLAPEKIATAAGWTPTRTPVTPAPGGQRPAGSFGELHHRIVEHYAPPSLLVNEELDIVHSSEHAGRYLAVPGGEPTRQVLRLVLPELRFELRGAIYAARQSERGSDTRVVRVEREGGLVQHVEIRVRAVDAPELGAGALLILFDELDEAVARSPINPDSEMEPLVREMEDELHRTRAQLRMTVEQYETALEEHKASNEELHAINEELRSATEELETSKEELQSVNEELTTLNHELKSKIDEVSSVNGDLQNLIASTDIGVLFLDRQLHIKRFTPRAREVFNVIASDIGRPFAHVTHNLTTADLVPAVQRVLADLRSTEQEVTTTSGTRFLARCLPYRSVDDRIDGVVLTLVDITRLRGAEEARERSEEALRTMEERLAFALRSAPVAVLAHDADLKVSWSFVHGRQVEDGDALAMFPPADRERYLAIARRVLERRKGERAELAVIYDGETHTYDVRIEPGREHSKVAVTAVGFDISPSKHAERTLRALDQRKDEFIATLSHELRNPLTPLQVAFDAVRVPHADPTQVAKALDIMDHQLRALTRLVDELLDLSRVTHGKVELDVQPVQLVRVIEAALHATRPLLDEARHKLDIKLPPAGVTVSGDFGRLVQVMTNLLSNAAKYTPPGGTIQLSVETVRSEMVRIALRDSGVGIQPELLPHIFEIFVQSRDERGRSRGGLGIGLSLVQNLVELHGGTVSARSDGKGTGATFTVELPLRKER